MAATKIPAHASRRSAVLLIAFGVAFILIGVVGVGMPISGVVLAVGGAAAVFLGLRILREGPVVQQVNLALERQNRGLYEEAEAILDAIPPARRRNQLRRAIEMQRSMLAFRRKDVDGAIAHATRAVEGRSSLFSRETERLQVVNARALRAIAAAAKDDKAMARSDIEAVRASPVATPSSLSRVSVAEAIGLSRAGEREKLAGLLRRDRKLLFEFTTPRDRALVRALQRTLYVSPGAAYREPPPVEPAADSDLGSWIAHLAPAAAGLAPRGTAKEALATEAATVEPKLATELIRKRSRSTARNRATLWSFLILMFVGIWRFLTPATPQHLRADASSASLPSSIPWVLPVIFVLLFVGLYARTRRALNRFAAATRLLALDDLAPAEAALRGFLSSAAFPGYAAGAAGALAGIAMRRSRYDDALTLVDGAIRRFAKNAQLSDLVLPALVGQRAYALAALGRANEASAELETLAAAHPTYPQLAAVQLTTRTLLAVKAGDIAGAAAIAARRNADLVIGVYDELLGDALVASTEARPMKPEVERLRADLETDAEARGWMKNVWPEAEAAIEEAVKRAA